uniref:hypothetical protein n=1 Tax=Leyella stercorea TaxID=363265 RepID=UPI004026B398
GSIPSRARSGSQACSTISLTSTKWSTGVGPKRLLRAIPSPDKRNSLNINGNKIMYDNFG